ncbi:MAG: GTP-binding protein [Acidimicrobiaceae bacterium]|nr:GTP-binding protein [Acidimicrobiaceae bacterium]
MSRVPVTILTGFLGSGKTTLLNRILTEHHGRRIAVIENEFGEIGIDQGLVVNADEEVFEMSNGCICCTVRGDLIRVLDNLGKRRDKFDYVLVETTGLADPGPVAQTFFMDDDIAAEYAIDGIVTVVDAVHVDQQLGRSRETEEQIAFADVVVLNKTDLVNARRVDELEERIRSMNGLAAMHRSSFGSVAVDDLLDQRSFDLTVALDRRPTFLEPEYPFEWTGVYRLGPGTHTLCFDAGPDPTMGLAVLPLPAPSPEALETAAEACVRVFAEPVAPTDGGSVTVGAHFEVALDGTAETTVPLVIEDGSGEQLYGLFCEHLAEEYHPRLTAADGGEPLVPVAERAWVAAHEHDDSVSSVGIEADGDVDGGRLNDWLGDLLRDKGTDLFRMKGFLAVAGETDRVVFQGVHMLLDSQPDRPWGDDPRRNQLVFIGRDLDADELRAGFLACLV